MTSPEPYETAGRIRRNLLTIRHVWAATITLIHRQTSDEPVTGSAASPALVPTHVLDARAECLRDLRLHVGIIRETIGGQTSRINTTNVDDLTRFLDTWALQYAEQLPDDADQCARDMRGHAERMQGLIRGDQLHRYQIGHCPELVGEEQSRCPGNLWASMRMRDAMLPQSIVCDADPTHAWAPWQWAALGKRLEVPA